MGEYYDMVEHVYWLHSKRQNQLSGLTVLQLLVIAGGGGGEGEGCLFMH